MTDSTAQPAQSLPRQSGYRARANVAVLGATGSIGTATVEVLQHLRQVDPSRPWRMWAASGHRQLGELAKIAASVSPSPDRLVLSSRQAAAEFLGSQPSDTAYEICVGPEALVETAASDEVDIVVAAIVGRAGLESTLAAAEAGKRIALANKETLVVAGSLVRRAMRQSGAELLPVDSEHSAIFQCLGNWGLGNWAQSGNAESENAESGNGESAHSSADKPSEQLSEQTLAPHAPKPRKLILTASGGPFRTWSAERIAAASPTDALAHPTWEMGRKISIDSATMMNKALEVIEARWLFDLPADAIDVVVHPQSIIHSMVEYDDGSVIAQLSPPDMRLPIQYALTYPQRLPSPCEAFDRQKSWDLSLEPADRERFPALDLGFEVARVGGTAGAVVNAANEAAVGLFLDGKIRFTDIVTGCRDILDHHNHESDPPLARLLELDRWARQEILRRFA